MPKEDIEAELAQLREAEDTLTSRIDNTQAARRSIQQRISELEHQLSSGIFDQEPPREEMPVSDALAIAGGSDE